MPQTRKIGEVVVALFALWLAVPHLTGAQAAPVPPPPPAAATQQPPSSAPQQTQTPIRTTANIVLVPALVKTRDGETVFSLNADDFYLTDNGVPQKLQMEPDRDAQPLAVVVIVETGGEGEWHLRDYGNLGAILGAVIGDVPHRVAVVSFDSAPHLEQHFSGDTDSAAQTIANLNEGDTGAAILDALAYGVDLLRQAPPAYRRAILLFSETADGGSQSTLEHAIREVNDTNTTIYSFAFSTTKTAVKHEASKIPLPGGTPYGEEPYPKGGCMSHDPAADPDAHGDRKVQALDCASDLLPPIRLARMAFIAAKDGMKRNVPEEVAQMTGGEYFPFTNAKSLAPHLIAISNDVPNYYVLSFRPESPTPGIHSLQLMMRNRPDLIVRARTTYWIDAGPPAAPVSAPAAPPQPAPNAPSPDQPKN